MDVVLVAVANNKFLGLKKEGLTAIFNPTHRKKVLTDTTLEVCKG